MTLARRLAATDAAPPVQARRAAVPTGFNYEWDGNSGVISTQPLSERPETWDEMIRDAGLDPAEVEVIEPVQVRGWDSNVGEGNVKRMHYYRLTVRRRNLLVSLDELVTAARRGRKRRLAAPPTAAGDVFLLALGDLQLGKVDGDGVEGTVQRFLDSTERAVERFKRLYEAGFVSSILLAHLGDCIEGMLSQGGANAWRTTLTTTEQVRLYRRLLIEQVRALGSLGVPLIVCGIPGNHDEAHRPIHSYGDSWAIDSIAAVKDALDLAGGYEHVTMLAPERDELTLTLDVNGTIVGMAHGHQWRTGQAPLWWAKQSHGRQPIGDADLLLSAHLHHLRIEETGAKTWMQVPALESESTWWRHRSGEVSRPGVITAIVGGGGWKGLEIL